MQVLSLLLLLTRYSNCMVKTGVISNVSLVRGIVTNVTFLCVERYLYKSATGFLIETLKLRKE